MFLTVTANAALDRLIFIPRFELATTMRTDRVIDAVGGKGFDVSVALRCLGQDTTAVGLIAGSIGQTLARIVEGYGIQTDLVWVEGETRTAHVIIETEQHRHSHIITGGYTVTPKQLQNLLDCYALHLEEAEWVAASGSLAPGVPVDFYATVTRMAHARGVPTLIDTSGIPLVQALSAQPEIVKMNGQELNSTFALEAASDGNLQEKTREVYHSHNLKSLVITRGGRGILAFTPEGDFQVNGPRLAAINAAGAGDAVSACLIWRLSQGDGWREALRWAAAAGASTVLTERTAECEWPVVQDLYPQIHIEKIG